ncbi:MAG TPA: GNAT family N-acetyltransferase, partial [Propionibacteriaceae bacterium]|nr:GNAT family N-acetyltransferase [Propionibacteriaceae bacterium]
MSTVMEDLLPVPAPELPSDRFLDRELSWLAFNNRVLDLAKDAKRVPLLERAKFLAIFSSNLDEFYMVRVAGLKRRIAAGVAVPTVSGMMPREVHLAILNRTRELVGEQAQVFHDDVRPGLAKEGIEILRWDELTGTEKDRMAEPWFDPAGFIVATIEDTMFGFHWTKQHQDQLGEVYVLGVAPSAAGRGLGKALLLTGLR